TLEQITTAAGPQLSIAASNVHLGLGDGTKDLLSIDGGTGFFVVGSSGLAGEFSGTVTANVPGVSFSGTFHVSVNTTGAAVDQQIVVGTSTSALHLPAGKFVRVEGDGVALTVLGQTL